MYSALKIGILGSGKLGTDLLIKTLRSKRLHCIMFSGRNARSAGINKAQSMNITTSTQSVDAFENLDVDIVFDVTSAEHHPTHAKIFSSMGVRVIDLTPSKIGPFCVPSINPHIFEQETNVNLVTCGGQSAIPIINCLSSVLPRIEQVEIHSTLAEDSVGPGTLANLDQYYSTTASAIREFSNVKDVTVNLSVEKSLWQPDMLTQIRIFAPDCDMDQLYEPLKRRLQEVRNHIPGYNIVGTPQYRAGCILITVSIRGQGDWIPSHAGNLDIINCAAIAIAEQHARYAEAFVPKRKRGFGFGAFFNKNRAGRRKEDAYV